MKRHNDERVDSPSDLSLVLFVLVYGDLSQAVCVANPRPDHLPATHRIIIRGGPLLDQNVAPKIPIRYAAAPFPIGIGLSENKSIQPIRSPISQRNRVLFSSHMLRLGVSNEGVDRIALHASSFCTASHLRQPAWARLPFAALSSASACRTIWASSSVFSQSIKLSQSS